MPENVLTLPLLFATFNLIFPVSCSEQRGWNHADESVQTSTRLLFALVIETKYLLAEYTTVRTYGCTLRQLEGEPFPLHQPVDAAVSVAGAAEVAQPTAASADERCGATQTRGGVGARQVPPRWRYRCLQ